MAAWVAWVAWAVWTFNACAIVLIARAGQKRPSVAAFLTEAPQLSLTDTEKPRSDAGLFRGWALLLAELMEVLIPMTLIRFDRDPAIGLSVLITVLTGSGGFFLFLGLAKIFLV